jgi:hypothetical protein
MAAFWGADDRYYIRLQHPDRGEVWFVGEGPVEATANAVESTVLSLRAKLGQGAARSLGPVLWGRSTQRAGAATTTVLAGRAGRSLRWPA